MTEKNQNQNQNTQDTNQLLKVRREKLAALQEAGQDPFQITKFDVTAHSSDIRDKYDELEGKDVTIAGRLMFKRVMGKASFCNVRDLKGDMQAYVARDSVGEEAYAAFKKWDIGDLVGITGKVFKTKTGEISVHAEEITLLSKSLQILPEKYHGITNTDMRYRQRYVDLIMNPEVKETFIKRSRTLAAIRRYLDGQGFMEVETPMLVANAGGAAARPFETHFNALNEDLKLRISLELYLKRLIVGGMERVYEIGRVFRNEGLDTRHNPEFTLMELYQAYTDYHGMMELTENMYRYVAQEVLGTTQFKYGDVELDFGKPFEVLSMRDAVKKYAGVDWDTVETLEDARNIAREKNVEFEERHKKGDILSLLFEEFAEEHLIQPTFVIDHPIEISPLTKKKPDEPDYVERFELFINGWEMANAYSELNDPIDQRERFKAQEEALAAGDEEANTTDEDFLNALEIGMPPTGGIGYGIDRLVMLLTNSAAIRDVLLFPTMKSLGGEKAAPAAPQAAPQEAPKMTLPTVQPKDGPGMQKRVEGATLKPGFTRAEAIELLKKYNKEEFHLQHAYTVESVMKWFAKELGEGDENFWAAAGLLHDVDFEQWPEEHCKVAPELLAEINATDELIHAVVCHGYGICSDVEPEKKMEKVLFAADELTGLIGAAALMRPSKSCTDMELKSLKKKFKDKKFAAGCDRDTIAKGAEILGWELDELLEKTLAAMAASEEEIQKKMDGSYEEPACGCGCGKAPVEADAATAAQADAATNAPADASAAASVAATTDDQAAVCVGMENVKVDIEPLFEEEVDFDTFSKSDFRAVKVLACEAVPKSKKLLQFTLDDGTGTNRTILSGIHAFYEPEELVGKTLVAITNLPPRAMMGIESCGMLLSAIHEEAGEEKLNLLMVADSIPAGAKLY